MERVLITGAAGDIGRRLRADMQGLYPVLRLSDRVAPATAGPGEEVVVADLGDLAACEAACAGVDGIVHLGGQAIEADRETVLQSNIVGCYNLFEAARRQGVRRVVFASTNHVIGFYPRTQRIDHRPRHGRTAATARARRSARRWARSTPRSTGWALSIRIGNYGERPLDRRRLSIWISPRDFLQLSGSGWSTRIRYEVVYGASDSDRSWWDNANAYRLAIGPRTSPSRSPPRSWRLNQAPVWSPTLPGRPVLLGGIQASGAPGVAGQSRWRQRWSIAPLLFPVSRPLRGCHAGLPGARQAERAQQRPDRTVAV